MLLAALTHGAVLLAASFLFLRSPIFQSCNFFAPPPPEHKRPTSNLAHTSPSPTNFVSSFCLLCNSFLSTSPTLLCLWLFFYIFYSLSSNSPGFQWNAGVLRARSAELLRLIFHHAVVICIRNPSSTRLSLSGPLDTLRSDPVLAFFFLMTARQRWCHYFCQAGPTLFLTLYPLSSLDPYSDYVMVVNISMNTSSTLSFPNIYASPICSSSTDSRTDSFPSGFPSCKNLFILGVSMAITLIQ